MTQPECCMFDHVDANGQSTAKLYEDRLTLAEAAEEAGFTGYYVAEHHSTPLGHASSPSLLIAALSQRTHRMRIGSMVHVLPIYQPLRLAEEICMLDHLSNGRLDIGVGRGASPFEVGLFGVSPQEARYRFEEALTIIQKFMVEDSLSHFGEFSTYRDVPLTMRPLQPGGPPMWYGALSERNLMFAASRGLNIVMNGPPARLRQLSTRYREICATDQSAIANPRMACQYQVFVADTDEEARRIVEPAYERWFSGMCHLWRSNNCMPRDNIPKSSSEAMERGTLIAGSASTVREKLQSDLKGNGLNRLLLQFTFGTIPVEAALNSIAHFKSDVMPHLSTAPAEPAILRSTAA